VHDRPAGSTDAPNPPNLTGPETLAPVSGAARYATVIQPPPGRAPGTALSGVVNSDPVLRIPSRARSGSAAERLVDGLGPQPRPGVVGMHVVLEQCRDVAAVPECLRDVDGVQALPLRPGADLVPHVGVGIVHLRLLEHDDDRNVPVALADRIQQHREVLRSALA